MAQPQLLRHFKRACAAMEPIHDLFGDPRGLAQMIEGIASRAMGPNAVELSGRCPDPDTGAYEQVGLTASRSGSWINLTATCTCCVLDGGEICVHGQALANAAWNHLHEDDGEPGLVRLHALLDMLPLGHRVAEDASGPPRADVQARAESLFGALAAAPEAAPGADQQRLAWRLLPERLRPVQPVVQTRGPRGWRKGRTLGPHDRISLALEQHDLALVQLIRSAPYGRSGLGRLADWRLLAGHPLLHGTDGAAVAVQDEALATAIHGRSGAWQVGFPQLDGGDHAWIETCSDGFAALSRDGRQLHLLQAGPEQLRLYAERGNLRIGDAVAASEGFRTVMARIQASLPPELEGEPAEADPAAQLLLAEEDGRLEARIAVRPLPSAPWQVPGCDPLRLHARDANGRWVVAVRNLREETGRGLALRDALGLPAQAAWTWRLDLEAAADLIERAALLHLRPHWLGEPLRTASADSAQLRISIGRRRDWFDVKAGVQLDDGLVALSELLAAARGGARWVRLDGGRLLRLGEDLRRRLGQLAAAGTEAPLNAAPVLDEALAGLADGQVQGDRAWLDLQQRLRSAQALQPEPPPGLRAELRDYQRQGFAWLARLAAWGSGAVLADDMGLGKTVQTIALLLHRAGDGAALVVCPTSVEGNWADELARFAPDLRVHLYRERRALDGLGPGDVLLASYGLVQRRAAEFAGLRVATLVADEAQQVKNADAKRTQSLAAVQAALRIALTGTPVENRLDELWSILALAVPGLLGSRDDFAARFAGPIEGEHDAGRRDELRRRISPFVLRRTKEAVAPELPPRTDITHHVVLRGPERALYDAERAAAIAALEAGKAAEPDKDQRFAILAALTRLRQLACAPGLVLAEYGAASAKLDALVELLGEMRAGGHRCLVFSQFTGLLDLAQERLRAAGFTILRLDGSTEAGKRRELVGLFQGGTGEVFLISLRAGGTGLNLTAADYVVHLDPWWNPAVEDQATDRAHRIGQTRPVTVYRLVASDTVEDRILEMHREKRDLVDALLEGSDRAGRLGGDELLALMRAG